MFRKFSLLDEKENARLGATQHPGRLFVSDQERFGVQGDAASHC